MLQNHFVKQHYIPYRFDIEDGKKLCCMKKHLPNP